MSQTSSLPHGSVLIDLFSVPDTHHLFGPLYHPVSLPCLIACIADCSYSTPIASLTALKPIAAMSVCAPTSLLSSDFHFSAPARHILLAIFQATQTQHDPKQNSMSSPPTCSSFVPSVSSCLTTQTELLFALDPLPLTSQAYLIPTSCSFYLGNVCSVSLLFLITLC